jgi:Meckel syndrome type 1 protein
MSMNTPLTREIWHLSIDDLLEPLPETPRLGGPGPFVINLSASTAPISPPIKDIPGSDCALVYQIKRTEDRRLRYRLRLGPFANEDDADVVLAKVREFYPSALTATADTDDLRTIASMQAKADALRSTAQKSTEGAPAPKAPAPGAASAASAKASSEKASVAAAPVPAVPAPVAVAPAPAATIADAEIAKPPAIAAAAPAPATPVAAAPEAAAPETVAPIAKAPVVAAPLTVASAPAAPAAAAPAPVPAAPIAAASEAAAAVREASVAEAPPVTVASVPAVKAPAPVAPVAKTPVAKAPAVVAPAPAAPAAAAPAPAPTAPIAAAPEAAAATPKAPVAEAPPVTVAVAPAVKAPAPVAPVAKTPVAKAPVAKAPVAKAPVAKAPLAAAPAPAALAVKPAAAAAPSVAAPHKTAVRAATAPVNPTPVFDPALIPTLTAVERVSKPPGVVDKVPRPAVVAAPVATPDHVERLDTPLDMLECTQTVRPLTPLELEDHEAARWFVIQLSLSDEAFDPDTVPNLDIFSVYRLYSVAGLDQGRIMHALRLGFFGADAAARAVASYLAAYYDKPTVKRVSAAERDRFAEERLDARKDIGATGMHAIIEITSERIVRKTVAAAQPKTPSHDVEQRTAARNSR